MYKDLNLTSTQVDAGEIFSGRKSGNLVNAYLPNDYTPKSNPDYILNANENYIDVISWALNNEFQPLLISGPHGAGKTSLIKEVASRINYPILELNGSPTLEIADYIGCRTINDKGAMEFQAGPLVIAAENGCIFLLNEVDAIPPSTLLYLHTILDGSPIVIEQDGGRIVTPKAGFKIAFTANGATMESSANYAGTNVLNMAFMDRLLHLRSNYMPQNVELNLLKKKFPSLPENILSASANLASEVRRIYLGNFNEKDEAAIQNSSIEITFSTRALMRFCSLLQRYQPLAKQGTNILRRALSNALTNSASPATAELVYGLAERIFPNKI